MEALKREIIEKGKILRDDLLKVDSFLNHNIDVNLMEEIGKEFARHFKDAGITKVVTIETGGIAPAFTTAKELGVPMFFCKKTEPSTMIDPVSVDVFSYTKQKYYTICAEHGCFTEDDRILFIDDFLANGEAFKGIEALCSLTGSTVAGVGVCIEKAYQKGHEYIVSNGYDLYPLASIAEVKDGKIYWADEENCEGETVRG